MKIHIISLFPESIRPYLDNSIMKKAQEKGLFEYTLYNLADWSVKNTRRVDDRPYGGGSGTIITIEPLTHCIRSILQESKNIPIFVMSPKGRILDQQYSEQISTFSEIIIICGHYEGIDARIFNIFESVFEVSIGKFVLSSGEIASLVFIDSVVRLIPGVLSEKSLQEESFSLKLGRKKEYPQFSRPNIFEGHKVPEVLLSGNFQEIEKWRQSQCEE